MLLSVDLTWSAWLLSVMKLLQTLVAAVVCAVASSSVASGSDAIAVADSLNNDQTIDDATVLLDAKSEQLAVAEKADDDAAPPSRELRGGYYGWYYYALGYYYDAGWYYSSWYTPSYNWYAPAYNWYYSWYSAGYYSFYDWYSAWYVHVRPSASI